MSVSGSSFFFQVLNSMHLLFQFQRIISTSAYRKISTSKIQLFLRPQ
jgi:hypothetical protein